MADTTQTHNMSCSATSRHAVAALSELEMRCHTNSAALHGPRSGYRTRSFSTLASMEAASVFHTVEALPLTLPNLLEMLVKCGLIYDESAALHAVVLMERYDARVRRVTFHMMHRLFVGALRVACKAHYDRNFSSSAFASCVGIKPQELKRLEATLLADLQWDVAVVGPPPPPSQPSSSYISNALPNEALPYSRFCPLAPTCHGLPACGRAPSGSVSPVIAPSDASSASTPNSPRTHSSSSAWLQHDPTTRSPSSVLFSGSMSWSRRRRGRTVEL
jgi:hypothetical protein